MSNWAIRAEALGKRYRYGARPSLAGSLRDALAALPGRLRRHSGEPQSFWALSDVSFEVASGEIVGVIGGNGTGKSTLLKILSRITPPSAGRAVIRGRVGSLLEVGTGFNPELTGRENIFLNGTILGMRRRDIAARLDAIVAFAGVEAFLDTPVKRYSSGMYVRLAFAVAAHLEPEVLLVDEVLAVGDAAFQAKSLGSMHDAAASGRTILFVSHNLGAVESLCGRVLWLSGGRLADAGEPRAVIERYLEASTGGELPLGHAGEAGPLAIERVTVRNARGEAAAAIPANEGFTVEIAYEARQPVTRPHFWISVLGQHGALFAANMLLDGRSPERVSGRGVVACAFAGLRLLPQTYTVSVGVRDHGGAAVLVPTIKGAAAFRVVGLARDFGMPAATAQPALESGAPLLVDYAWRFGDGTVASPPWVDRK